MKTLVGSLVLVSSFTVVAAGCANDATDDLTSTEDALTCGGFHHGNPGQHIHHDHHRHHHHHSGGGTGGSGGQPHLTGTGGTGGTGGQPHLTGVGGTGGSDMSGAAGSGMIGGSGGSGMTGGSGGSGMTGGSGGTMPDPRCAQMDGIISWWHGDNDFDDAVGTNDGTNGGAASFAPGEEAEGFNLNGTMNSFVVVPDAADLMPMTAITLDAWINTPAPGGRIIDKITAFFTDGYLLDMVGDHIRMLVGGDNLVSDGSVPAGIFTHVAGVYGPDPANPGTFKFSVYINGALAGEKTTLQPSVPGNLFPEPVHIGADSGGGSLFTGVIDEPRIWNRALTADEIQTLVFQSTNCQ